MKQIFATGLVLLLSATLTAQVSKIQKAWAFVTESMPGRAMQDENGNTITPQPISQRFIFIETNYKGTIKTDSVWYNDKLYKAQAVLIKEAKHNAGVIYTNGNPFYITPKKGNKLWRIDVEPATGQTVIAAGSVKKITIKGNLGAAIFKQNITAEVRLVGPEYN